MILGAKLWYSFTDVDLDQKDAEVESCLQLLAGVKKALGRGGEAAAAGVSLPDNQGPLSRPSAGAGSEEMEKLRARLQEMEERQIRLEKQVDLLQTQLENSSKTACCTVQ